jgi:L-ascorbate metabolism protein UlaG (beta-lactamase superfamily)
MRKERGGSQIDVIPAKAGIHASGAGVVDKWGPAFAGVTFRFYNILREPSASFAAKCFFLGFLAIVIGGPARAECGVVAERGARLWRAAAQPEQAVAISFLGHASFMIESPEGVRIVTDYNDMIGAPLTPDIVTMNNAHPTHYTEHVDPAVKYVLRGWDPAGGVAAHRLEYKDVKVHNVPTNLREGNLREFGATRYNGNSIFVFEMAGLCIAHLGHLHHTLTETHLAELGAIDIVMVPVDGAWTLNQEDMTLVLAQIKPAIVIPMHVFTAATLERFLARAAEHYRIRHMAEPRILVSRADLPAEPEIRVLPGR